jgi:tRNA(fMet)-specific endonuclease VapC
MSLYVLDTDILSLNQTGNAIVRQRIAEHVSQGQIAVTIISVEEQLSGWYSLRRRVKRRADLAYAYQRFSENVQLLKELQILSFPESAIEKYEELHRLKLGVRGNDLRIAAIALDNSAAVVTRNLRDFQRVPGLHVEDWSA